MKRLIWSITLLFLGSLSVKAQSQRHFGGSYTPTIAQIEHFNYKTNNHWYGQQICLLFRWKSSKLFSSQIGLGYAETQSEYASHGDPYGDHLITRYQHKDLIIPFQLQYSFSEKNNRFFVAGGAMLGFNLDRKVTESWREAGIPLQALRDITAGADYKIMEFNISVGLGYEFNLKKGSILMIQPNFQSNVLTVLAYFPKEYLGPRYGENGAPPAVNVLGIGLTYFLK